MTIARPHGKQVLAGALVTGVCLAAAPAASADSIAFLRGGDAYLATTDGSREVRLTTGRTFNGITQSDDGRVFAVEAGVLYTYDRSGNQIGGPTGIIPMGDPDVSPDGSKLAFHYTVFDGSRYTVRNVDGSSAGWGDQNGGYSSWITNDLTIESGAGWVSATHAGAGGWNNWFSEPDGRKHDNAITRAGDRLVVVVRDYEDVGPWSIAHYSNSSPPPRNLAYGEEPPGGKPQLRCVQDYGGTEPRDPSFSPDGTRIAWELPDGVHVLPVYDLGSCTQPAAGAFVIPGAQQPDWGPADVPLPTQGQPGVPGTQTGGPGPGTDTQAGGEEGPLGSARASRRVKIKTALRKGVRVKITCSSPCKVSGDLRYKRKVVAKGEKSVKRKGTVVLKFTAKGKKTLRRLKKGKLAMRIKATDGQKRKSTKTGSIALKR